MNPADSDPRVMRLARESQVWRAGAAVLDGLVVAWRHSATGRICAAISEAGASSPLRRVRALADVTLVAGLAAAVFSFAGTRRDGATWLVPVVAAVAAAVVMALVRVDGTPAHRE